MLWQIHAWDQCPRSAGQPAILEPSFPLFPHYTWWLLPTANAHRSVSPSLGDLQQPLDNTSTTMSQGSSSLLSSAPPAAHSSSRHYYFAPAVAVMRTCP